MKWLTIAFVALLALTSSSRKKPAPVEAKSAPPKGLREVIVGTWTVRELKGTRTPGFTMTSTYTADGWNENKSADGGRSSREQYRVVDDKTIEAVGPPPERMAVDVVSPDELRMTSPDGKVVLQCVRRSSP